jgi:exosortase/archaeosortase family protein
MKKKTKDKPAPKRVHMARFILTYIILSGVFFFLMGFAPIHKYIDINDLYSKSIVFITHSILLIFNVSSSYHGTILALPNISLDVMFGCNGLEAVMIYSIAVIAFPASWKNKLIGITAGFLIIQVVNLLRIVTLAYVAVEFYSMFKTIHVYVAQGIMIAVALAIFFIYLNYEGRKKEDAV